MKKIKAYYDKISFYLFNIIIFTFFMEVYRDKMMMESLVLLGSIIAIVGTLCGMCYSGANLVKDKTEKKIFIMAGHRFFYCFLMFIFASVFIAYTIYTIKNGILGIHNKTTLNVFNFIIGTVALIGIVTAARSFSMGFHMIKKSLNPLFPLKDETLYDDLEKEL